MDKIVAIQTERKIEDNLTAIGSEYFDEVSEKGNLAIYGAIDKITHKLVVVARSEVTETLMGIINQINHQWSSNNGVQ